jgi:poly(glycerol-phosphate) alpha-glucosyltransferase
MGGIEGQPLYIGIVTPTISRAGGGIFPVVLAHARELTRLGHRVTVYGLNDDPHGLDRNLWSEVNLKVYRKWPFGFSPLLASDLRRGAHDLLHQHGLWLYISVAVNRWRKLTGKPVIISAHGMLEPWALANSSWKKWIAGLIFERQNVGGASTIQCSGSEVQGVRSYMARSVVAMLPNGTELVDLHQDLDPPNFMLSAERRTLLFLGRLHPKKGIEELIRAWGIIKELYPSVSDKWQLVIAGWDDGHHVHSWELLASSLGLKREELIFSGPCFGAEKIEILSYADAFILPSYSEGLPIAVLEAWSFALPVFMTRECNIPDGFEAGAAIEITNRPEALARILAERLPGVDLPEIGKSGRNLVEQRFAWPKIVNDLSLVYQWIVYGFGKPSFVLLPYEDADVVDADALGS